MRRVQSVFVNSARGRSSSPAVRCSPSVAWKWYEGRAVSVALIVRCLPLQSPPVIPARVTESGRLGSELVRSAYSLQP
ncbi:MAG: hypothetical protein HY704_00505 [Gemmatimonadetes bacterium]|nr:hypothetical protein [Gemmatimonadota bacterium]